MASSSKKTQISSVNRITLLILSVRCPSHGPRIQMSVKCQGMQPVSIIKIVRLFRVNEHWPNITSTKGR